MAIRIVPLGTRKLQNVHGTLTLNIPRVAVDTLGFSAGEVVHVSMMPDDSLRIVKT